MFYQSSYALFSTDKTSPLGQSMSGDAPYAFSGKRSTHERQDTAIQQNLKKWARDTHFAKNNVIEGDRTVDLSKASN